VWRPEIITSDSQFLFLNPVDFAVQDIVAVVLRRECQLVLARISGKGTHVQVVLAYIGNPLALGRKLGIAAGICSRGHLDSSARLQRVIPELTLGVEQQMLGIRR